MKPPMISKRQPEAAFVAYNPRFRSASRLRKTKRLLYARFLNANVANEANVMNYF
jgi:hypothetical protein